MRDLNDLYYFVEVVNHRGFSPAGRALGMPKSKLSRRIALLEERLGTRLIQRSTRRFTVTEVGQVYYQHCRAMLIEAEAADEAIALRYAEPRGVVRVTCPVALLDSRVGEMLAEFMVQYPLVDVHLEATNRRVDVVGEGIDVAIRVRPPPLEDSDAGDARIGGPRSVLSGQPRVIGKTGITPDPRRPYRLAESGFGRAAKRPRLDIEWAGRRAGGDSPSAAFSDAQYACIAGCGGGWRGNCAVADHDADGADCPRGADTGVAGLAAATRNYSCGFRVTTRTFAFRQGTARPAGRAFFEPERRLKPITDLRAPAQGLPPDLRHLRYRY
ncbi:DNA-binding transcriptional LysR family regulator [Ewingella americana]